MTDRDAIDNLEKGGKKYKKTEEISEVVNEGFKSVARATVLLHN